MNSLAPSTMQPVTPTIMQELLTENKNGFCADCGMTLTVETAWAVLSCGIFVCDDCKLVHIEQENHYKGLEQANDTESSVTGILPAAFPQLWNEKDVEQMKGKGNEKVNQKLLSNVPAWQYRPTAHDGIKHKEYWIKYKYSKRVEGEGEEVPKIAGKSFIGIQFTRPMPKGNYPCCAVLQNEKLYLTSDVKNEEIQIENIETVLLNSKRIGRENGVQLTYRTNGPVAQNGVTYTYLQHDNMETVLDWINLVLYTKYILLKKKYSSYSQAALANMLNCAMVKESYMSASSHGLVYVSLSEARLACFKHHLDDKPLFHLPITKALKFTGCQYLDAVAHFFSMDVSKLYGYEEWNSCLEFALSLDKLGYLGDEIVKPVNSVQLLPPSKPVPASPLPYEGDAVAIEKTEAALLPPTTTTTATLVNTEVRNNGVPDKEYFKDERAAEKPPEKSEKKSYECYPPIGPMGEMGKVARGELPPEAIKPPPPKNDLSRTFGMIPHTAIPQSTHGMMTSPPMVSMNHSLSQQPMRQNNVDCYPPITGPIREMVKPGDMFNPQHHMPRDDGYPVIDEFKPHAAMNSASFRTQDSAYGSKMPLGSMNSFGEADISQYSRMPVNNGWIGDTDNLLTVPWKQTRNGYEPARGFSQSQAYDNWNDVKLAGMRSPDLTPQQVSLGRSASWNPGSMEQWHMKQQEQYFSHKPILNRSSLAAGGHEHVIMEQLQQQWTSAERKLLTLIHNGYVPASNMTAAGLDADDAGHAQTCVSELFDLLWKQRYDLALSFLRGFREVFSRSLNPEIRNRFIGVGELDTMKQIFLQQGREKFIRANTGGPVTWKQPSPSPTNLDQAWPASTPTPVQHESPTDFTPWGPMSPNLTPNEVGLSTLWGSTPATPAGRTVSVCSDPWSITSTTATSSHVSLGSNGSQSFNRAPSRPVSLTRSSLSENSPTEGSFGSKTSSNSASPGVITPPASLDSCMTSAALTGIETTLKNLFLNSNASGSTLWN